MLLPVGKVNSVLLNVVFVARIAKTGDDVWFSGSMQTVQTLRSTDAQLDPRIVS